jgi:NTE family protein
VNPPGTPDYGDLALVLTGGGARAAYQVGLLRHLAERYPDLRAPILTGVSAGAVNAVHLAAHHGTFAQAVEELSALWLELTPERVFRADTPSLAWNVARSGVQLVSGGLIRAPRVQGMLDTAPLRQFLNEVLPDVGGVLAGIEHNVGRGTLNSVAVSTTSYTTGQSVVWVQGRDIVTWKRPKRRSVHTRLTVDHVMASTARPLLFPAVQIGDQWYGDGGIRLTAPLSPALHLGAHKILAVSPRYDRSTAEGERPQVRGYPPPAQVLGLLYNAVFLDLIDQDAMRMERMNRVLRKLRPEDREDMRVVELLVMRPSRDLGRLARGYEPRLPATFRFLTRGLGTRESRTADLLSMIMFQGDYIRRLMELGEADAAAREEEIAEFLAR